ncbi:hypothetical protein HK105_208115 [Polyrhizophydium stewartii]|uniref:holo-[acyl-carrier-protein] synthase n=1 Tax=Polyrhizophydium stewartii TaxID=2732419 RepID=A0ABR4MYP8_9FUNG|nr:hypothetical protein HK105_005242 [Polyrhizophydium stewartii]
MEASLAACLAVLPDEERKRVGQFRFRSDALAALAGLMLPRAALCQELGVDVHDLEFHRTEIGRPYMTLRTGAPLVHDYNVSHHGEYILMAVSGQHRLGVDVTRIDTGRPTDTTPARDFLGYYDEQFSRSEWTWIWQGPSGLAAPNTRDPVSGLNPHAADFELLKRFHCMWALKEAYVKGVGCGIIIDLTDIVFTIRDDFGDEVVSTVNIWPKPLKVTLHIRGKLDTEWSFHVSLLDDFHIVCVASKPGVAEVGPIERIAWKDVLNKCAIKV